MNNVKRFSLPTRRSALRRYGSAWFALVVLTMLPASSWGVENGSPSSDANVFAISGSAFNADLTGTTTKACSAVLITPGHILTAAHCLIGSHNLRNLNDLLGDPTQDTNSIVPGTSIRIENAMIPIQDASPIGGDVSVFTPSPGHAFAVRHLGNIIDFSSASAGELDLAIIPLDTRVPTNAVAPANLPFHNEVQGSVNVYVADPCPESFAGRVVGYGGGIRNFANVGVTRQLNSINGNVYRTDYSAVHEIVDLTAGAVTGILDGLVGGQPSPSAGTLADLILQQPTQHLLQRGDSGGALFDGNTVCGINSSDGLNASASVLEICVIDIFGIEICHDACVPGTDLCAYAVKLTVSNRHARVDSPGAVNWLNSASVQPPIYDSRGNLFSTCPSDTPPAIAALANTDFDGDMMPDACDPCPSVPDLNYKNNGLVTPLTQDCSQASATLLCDQDGDEIPDICDNCPRTPNPRQVFAFTFLQFDSDGDQVGDACDKCAHSELRPQGDLQCCNGPAACSGSTPDFNNPCVPISPIDQQHACPGFFGRCAIGKDSDHDGFPDGCDNCTSTFNSQSDTDDDGVGDDCDNCSGKHVSDPTEGADKDTGPDPNGGDKNHVTCATSAECVTKTGEADSECEPQKLRVDATGFTLDPNRYCSKLSDLDDDNLGDKCDNCSRMPNPQQRNCNRQLELALGVPYPRLGDACDANPCAWVPHFSINATTFDINNPSAADLWVTFPQHPQRLPSSVPACTPSTPFCFQYPPGEAQFNTSYTGTPVADVGGRFCPCDPDPTQADPATIAGCKDTCELNAARYNDAQSIWTAKLPSLIVSSNPPLHQPSGFFSELPGLTMEASREVPTSPLSNPTFPLSNLSQSGLDPTSVSWNLTADGAGPVAGSGTFNQIYGKNGVYWSAVRNIPQMLPGVASTYETYSNSYFADVFGLKSHPDIFAQAVEICPGGNCDDACPYCNQWVDAMDMLVSPEGKVLVKGTQGVVDVSPSFSAAAIMLLASPDTHWMAASDPGRFIQRSDIALAAVSPDGTMLDAGLARVGAQIQPVVRGTRIGIGIESLAAVAASDPPGPPARSNFGRVLSANEKAVYVIGGTLASSGEAAADLWQYDFAGNSWRRLNVNGPTPKNVLAATYLPQTRSLYFIDEVKVGWFKFARLVRYDINQEKTTVLGQWPRTPFVDKVFLTSGDNGTLVVAGSSTKLEIVAGVVVRPSANFAKVEAGFIEKGVLALRPVLTDNGLTLPLVSSAPSGITNEFIPIADLYPKPKKGKAKGWFKKPPASIGECL